MKAGEGPRRRGAGSTEQLLAALVAGHSVRDAAGLSGMAEETARRRIRQPDVKAQLADLRSTILATAADRLAALALGAATVLGEMMTDSTLSPSIRLRAASEVLGRAVPLREAAYVEDRLLVVEAALERRESGSNRSPS